MLCTGLIHMVSGDTTRHSMQSVIAPSQQFQKVTRMRDAIYHVLYGRQHDRLVHDIIYVMTGSILDLTDCAIIDGVGYLSLEHTRNILLYDFLTLVIVSFCATIVVPLDCSTTTRYLYDCTCDITLPCIINLSLYLLNLSNNLCLLIHNICDLLPLNVTRYLSAHVLYHCNLRCNTLT